VPKPAPKPAAKKPAKKSGEEESRSEEKGKKIEAQKEGRQEENEKDGEEEKEALSYFGVQRNVWGRSRNERSGFFILRDVIYRNGIAGIRGTSQNERG